MQAGLLCCHGRDALDAMLLVGGGGGACCCHGGRGPEGGGGGWLLGGGGGGGIMPMGGGNRPTGGGGRKIEVTMGWFLLGSCTRKVGIKTNEEPRRETFAYLII